MPRRCYADDADVTPLRAPPCVALMRCRALRAIFAAPRAAAAVRQRADDIAITADERFCYATYDCRHIATRASVKRRVYGA